jgi:hypothetical protein
VKLAIYMTIIYKLLSFRDAMKRFLVAVLLLLVFIPTAISATEFWGSKTSNKYHYPTCKWTKQISPSNLVKFKSPEEAQKAGYIPCPVCKPPKPIEYFDNEASILFRKDMTDQTQVLGDFYSGNDLVELIKADAGPGWADYAKAEKYIAYIIGVYDATSYAYNTPSSLTKGQIMAVVTSYLMNHSEQWGDPASLLVIRALKEAFPKYE